MELKEVIMAGGLLLITWAYVFFMWLKEMKKEYEEIELLTDKEK